MPVNAVVGIIFLPLPGSVKMTTEANDKVKLALPNNKLYTRGKNILDLRE